MPYAYPGGISQNQQNVEHEIPISDQEYLDAYQRIRPGRDAEKLTIIEDQMVFYKGQGASVDSDNVFAGMVSIHIPGQPLITEAPARSLIKPTYQDGAWIEGDPEAAAERDRQAQIAVILARLDEIDMESLRPLRAKGAGNGNNEDTQKLEELEQEAESLRAQLANL